MPLSALRRYAVPALVLAVLLVAGGVGYAVGASTTSSVTACATSKGRLALQKSDGRCPSGFSAVRIGKQGPRGPRGPQGVAAPRPTRFVHRTTYVTNTPVVTVRGVKYVGECAVVGPYDTRQGTMTFRVTAPAGRTVRLVGEGVDPSAPAAPSASVVIRTFGSTVASYNPALQVVVSDGSIAVVSLNMVLHGPLTDEPEECEFIGTISAL